ncbi:hypothetical protein Tco_0853066, partial [Tanacetum coccineum]
IFSTVSQITKASGTNLVNTGGTNHVSIDTINSQEDDSEIPPLEDIHEDATDGIFTHSSYDDEGAVADFTNLETIVNVSPIPTSRVHPSHPLTLILGDPTLAVQTRSIVNKSSEAHAFKILEALKDESWVDAMQEELLQFEIQKVWILVDLPYGKKAIGTKWVYRNKKDESGCGCRNKARLSIRWMKQLPFSMARIDEEVMCSTTRFPSITKSPPPDSLKVVFKALYGLHQAPRAWYATLSTFLLKNGYRRGTIDKTCKFQMSSNGESHFLSRPTIADYVAQILSRKSTTGGCQFLRQEDHYLAQCKKQTHCSPSTLKKQIYVAAQVARGQNPSISVEGQKHIAIRHHFIRDAYEKKLIQVLKIHTNDNVADLLTKAFDVSRFQFLVVSIGMVPKPIKKPFLNRTLGAGNPLYLSFSLHALISLIDDHSLLSKMAALESCPKHNYDSYLEKTEGIVEFHEVIDFLQRSYISHALTVSPIVSTTFVEQFWTSAKSKTINNVRHITAKVAGKLVSISEASIRTDLLFDDADGNRTLPNQVTLIRIQAYGI